MEISMEFEPICMKEQLLIPEQVDDPQMVVICLWTPRAKVMETWKEAGMPMPAAFGQLYSSRRGCDPFVRNLLANPHINRIIVCGEDKNGSGRDVVDLLTTEPGDFADRFGLGDDIDAEMLSDLVNSVCVVDSIGSILKAKIEFTAAEWTRTKRVLPPPPPPSADTGPGPAIGSVIRAETISDGWVLLLDYIRRYGTVTGTHYSQPQQEIYGMTLVVEDAPGLEDEEYPDWLPIQGVRQYAIDLWTGVKPETTKYTYGWIMRHPVDQIAAVIEKLLADPDQRSAKIVLWREEDITTASGTPCMNTLHFRRVGDKLHMSVTIRSNDMFAAWPKNIRGVRYIQEKILEELQLRVNVDESIGLISDLDIENACHVGTWNDVKVGVTMVYSESAHIYADSWQHADMVISKQLAQVKSLKAHPYDPFGNWIISVSWRETDKQFTIRVEQVDAVTDTVVRSFSGHSALHLSRQIAPWLQKPSHAVDIGLELQKAELCGRLGIPYEQDKPFPYEGMQRAGQEQCELAKQGVCDSIKPATRYIRYVGTEKAAE